MRRISLLILLLFLQNFIQGQDYGYMNLHNDPIGGNTQKYYPVLSTYFEFGVNLPGNDVVAEELFTENDYQAGSFNISFQTYGRNIYETLYRFPKMGIGYSGFNLNNDSTVGAPNSMFAFIDVPINKYREGKRWNFYYQIAAGLSFNFRPGNTKVNPVNSVIGSYNNVFIDLGFYTKYLINPSFDVAAGLNFTHFSNGANNLPNLGINLVGAKVIVSHNMSRKRPTKVVDQNIKPWDKVHQLFVYQAFGSKQVEIDGDNFLNTTTSLGYKYWYHYKGRIVASVDFFYDGSSNSGQGNRDIVPVEDRDNALNEWSTGIFLGHEAIYKRWSFLAGWGVYALRRYDFTKPSYQRIGAQYRLWDGLFVGVALKARSFAADYVEWSVGYNF